MKIGKYGLQEIKDGRKKREKETGEKLIAKYKMYIVPHKGFVSNYQKYGRLKMSGKRYCFEVGKYDEAIKLNIEEVINCIADCGNSYCNWRYKVLPEDEFLEEYQDFKEKHLNDLQESYEYRGFGSNGIDTYNILHQPKRKKVSEWGCLIRDYYGDLDIFGGPTNAIPFYSLRTRDLAYSSMIIDYKKTDEGIEFETANSIYVVKEMKNFGYINQLKEFDDFKASVNYTKLMKYVEDYEASVMKNIMEGKEYIN